MKRGFCTNAFLCVAFLGYTQEICNNGFDDDLDGLIDLQDTVDCSCQVAPSSVDTITSLIPNYSFESKKDGCCFSHDTAPVNDTIGDTCAYNWIRPQLLADPDYFHCACPPRPGFNPPSFPLPGGGCGYYGFANVNVYKEYVGVHLISPLMAGTSYTLTASLAWGDFDTTLDFSFYGTPNGNDLSLVASWPTFGCPIGFGSWVELAKQTITFSKDGKWKTITMTFTPTVNIDAVVIGGSCWDPTKNEIIYYYVDELLLKRTVVSPPLVDNASISSSGHSCQGNLQLKADHNGSVPNSFQWYKDKIAIVGATDSIYQVSNGAEGKYQVLLTYDSNCVITPFYEVKNTVLRFELDSSIVCQSDQAPTGQIKVRNVNSGATPYVYQLDDGAFVPDSVFNNLSPRIYTITVRDANLCEASKMVEIDTYPTPKASFEVDTVCLGEKSVFRDNSTISEGSIAQWGWNTPDNSTTKDHQYQFANQGVYPITHTVISNHGCVDDTTINVVVLPKPQAGFDYTPKALYSYSSEACFLNTSNEAVSYLWDFGFVGAEGTSTSSNPCVDFPAVGGAYRVQLKAINEFGCGDSVVINIVVEDDFKLYVPNSFSPNGDQVNDELVVVSTGVEEYKLTIFNRWGEVVFETSKLTEFWDGNYNGMAAEQGVYPYKLSAKGINNKLKEVVGHVTLLR